MSQPRVLIVDDDEMIVDVFREGFTPELEVHTALSAEAGLQALRTHDIEVVVSDIRMPGMDGLAFLQHARLISPDVPVVFLTAYKNADYLTRAMQLGAFDLADKPFSLDSLRAVLQRALQQHRRLKQRRRTEALARQLNRCHDLDSLLSYLERDLAGALGLRLFSLFLYEPELQRLRLVASNHVSSEVVSTVLVSELSGPMRRVIDTREAVTLHPEERGPRERRARYLHDVSLTLPLLVGERLVGVLNLNDKTDAPVDFDELDLAFLTIAAEHLASAVAVHQQSAELNRALTTLQETQRRLIQSEKLAALTKLIAGVAHELKNPLTSLHLAAVNLENALHQAPEGLAQSVAPFLRSIHSDVDRLQIKVESFLAFARPRHAAAAPTKLRELLHLTVEQLAPRAQAARVELQLHVVDTLPEQVEIDPKAMGEAVVNLVVNGMEAAGPGGWVRVEATGGAGPGEIVITVTDSGPGVGPGVAEHIFDLFFTTKPKGSGIGLAQVHAFCDVHGGKVELISGAQTTFRMSLRAAPVAQPGGQQ